MSKNKIKYGLKKLHWAKITRDEDGKPTYAAPVAEPGATEFTAEKNVDVANIAADDNPMYASAIDDKGYTIEVNLQVLSDEFKIANLGWIKDSNGVLLEVANPVIGEFALLVEFNGDKHATRHVFYCCTATKPNIESKTKGDGLESQPDTVEITAAPDPYYGTPHGQLDASSGDANYESWFSSVYVPSELAN